MKKIYLVGLAFALLTASCDDVLEKTSSTQLPTRRKKNKKSKAENKI